MTAKRLKADRMSDKMLGPYPVAWARIQQAKRRAAIGTWAFLAFMVLLGMLIPRHSPMRFLMLVPAVIGATALVAYLAKFRCPHCDARIMVRGRLEREARLANGKCSHCGTQIGPFRP